MKLSDVLQIISVLAVAVALMFNYRQARETGRQASEAARQVQVSTSILKRDVDRQLEHYSTEMLASFLTPDPKLLEWFLATRGISAGTHEENVRRLFLFVRTDVHAFAYGSHRSDQLAEESWTAWLKVIQLDFATPEFQALWPAIRDQYTADFAAFVDAVLARPAAAVQTVRQR
ncbi:hypothetical protein OHA21_17575 [Actinoplanes sp. NBC_00393]|uniref:hypothetical protein n=1 Tax=Actinoplanes sp. NBC_00393 TaxID=2975953 RepID=UPI002E1D12E8